MQSALMSHLSHGCGSSVVVVVVVVVDVVVVGAAVVPAGAAVVPPPAPSIAAVVMAGAAVVPPPPAVVAVVPVVVIAGADDEVIIAANIQAIGSVVVDVAWTPGEATKMASKVKICKTFIFTFALLVSQWYLMARPQGFYTGY